MNHILADFEFYKACSCQSIDNRLVKATAVRSTGWFPARTASVSCGERAAQRRIRRAYCFVSPEYRTSSDIVWIFPVRIRSVQLWGASKHSLKKSDWPGHRWSALKHETDFAAAPPHLEGALQLDSRRRWAARYKAGDVLKYETGSKAHGIARNSTATVLSADASNNTVTVQPEDVQAVTYDPKRLKGLNVYRKTQKDFATRDRVQFTARNKELGADNGDLCTVTKLATGQI